MAVFSERIALTIDANTGGAVGPLNQLKKSATETEDAFDRMGRKIGIAGSTLRTGLASLGGAVIGAGLVASIRQVTDAYSEAVTAANLLANATNATLEEASAFAALTSRFGLDINDLTEIFADFQQSARGSEKELAALGVTIEKNANGTTNWVTTTVGFLEKLQGIGDATERNRLMFKYFGEEGAKQLMALLNSGVSVEEALKRIAPGQIFGTDDLRAVQEYDRAMVELSGSAQGLQMALGRGIVPLLTDIVQVATPLANAFSKISTETLLMAAAAGGVLKYWGPLATAAGGLRTALSGLGDKVLSPLTVDFGDLGLAADRAGDKVDSAKKKMSGQAKFALGVTSAIVAWEALSAAVESYNSQLSAIASEVPDIGLLTDEDLRKIQDGLSLWEKFGQTVRGLFRADSWKQTLLGPFFDDNNSELRQLQDELQKTKDAERDLAEAQGAAAVAALENKDAQAALKEMLVSGVYTQDQLAEAVARAANAQETQNRASEDAARLMKDYADSTYDALNAQLALIDSRFAEKDAQRGWLDSLKEYTKVAKDRKSTADEIAQAEDSAAQAALRYADAQVRAAGLTLDTAKGQQVYLDALKEMENQKGIPKSVRDSVRDLRIELEGAALQAEGGIKVAVETIIDDQGRSEAKTYIDSLSDTEIKMLVATGPVDDTEVQKYIEKRYQKVIDAEVKLTFDGEYKTQAEVQAEIDKLFSQGKISEAIALQGKLDAIVEVTADTTAAETSISNIATPAPIQVEVTSVGAEQVTATLASIPEKKDVNFALTTSGWFAVDQQLRSLDKDREVVYKLSVSGWSAVNSWLNSLDRDREVVYRVRAVKANPAGADNNPSTPWPQSAYPGTTVVEPQVSVFVQDHRLTDLIDVEIGGRSQADARRFVRRNGVV